MEYVICPLNAEHKVHASELRMHLMTCQNQHVKRNDKLLSQQPSKKKTHWVAFPLEEEEDRRSEQEMQVFDPQDPDRLLQCPYDSNHQIRACRFPYHLIKCRKNNHGLANQFSTCPFNARHMVPRGELSFHISRCEDKGCIEQDIVGEKSMYKRDVSPSRWNSPPCTEDWDKDLESDRSTFVWGIPSYPVPSSGTLMDPKTSLCTNLRAPKTFPYVLPWQIHKA